MAQMAPLKYATARARESKINMNFQISTEMNYYRNEKSYKFSTKNYLFQIFMNQ